jgi:hypothetical protein
MAPYVGAKRTCRFGQRSEHGFSRYAEHHGSHSLPLLLSVIGHIWLITRSLLHNLLSPWTRRILTGLVSGIADAQLKSV